MTGTPSPRYPRALDAYRVFARFKGWNDLRRAGSPGRAAGRDIDASFPHRGRELLHPTWKRSLVVFAATMGEFKQSQPVIEAWGRRYRDDQLILMAGGAQYLDAFVSGYPHAIVGLAPIAHPSVMDAFMKAARPRLAIISEGPCLHLHYPIRFDLTVPAACLYHGVPLIVVNASLLHKPNLESRLDIFEHRWFRSLHCEAVSQWYAPSEPFRDALIEAGAPAERIAVLGDTKFDLVFMQDPQPPTAGLLEVLAFLKEAGGPIIVGGSVNAADEQAAVIEGWAHLRQRHPTSKLVLAPRRIDVPEVMKRTFAAIERTGARAVRRTQGMETLRGADAVVIDTFGELPHFYDVASISYIGRDHGLTEPMRYGKPIVVAPDADWAKDYTTYPLYRYLVDKGAIIAVQNRSEIGDVFCRLVEDNDYRQRYVQRAGAVASEQRGAGERIVRHVLDFTGLNAAAA